MRLASFVLLAHIFWLPSANADAIDLFSDAGTTAFPGVSAPPTQNVTDNGLSGVVGGTRVVTLGPFTGAGSSSFSIIPGAFFSLDNPINGSAKLTLEYPVAGGADITAGDRINIDFLGTPGLPVTATLTDASSQSAAVTLNAPATGVLDFLNADFTTANSAINLQNIVEFKFFFDSRNADDFVVTSASGGIELLDGANTAPIGPGSGGGGGGGGSPAPEPGGLLICGLMGALICRQRIVNGRKVAGVA